MFHRASFSNILEKDIGEYKVQDAIILVKQGVSATYHELRQGYASMYNDLLAFNTPTQSIEDYVKNKMERVDHCVNMYRDELVNIKYPAVAILTSYALYDREAWTAQIIKLLTADRITWVSDIIQKFGHASITNQFSTNWTSQTMRQLPQVQPRAIHVPTSNYGLSSSLTLEAWQFTSQATMMQRYVDAYHKLKTNPYFSTDEGLHLLNHGLHTAISRHMPLVLIDEEAFEEIKCSGEYSTIFNILDRLLIIASEKNGFEYRDIEFCNAKHRVNPNKYRTDDICNFGSMQFIPNFNPQVNE